MATVEHGQVAPPEDLFSQITACRVCHGSDITDILTFGGQFLGSHFVEDNEQHPLAKIKIPMTLVLCEQCGMVQLKQTFNRRVLYRDYFYRSGTNPMMRSALQDVVDEALAVAQPKPGDYVVDVGCNDGTMLSLISDQFHRIGVEPAENIDWSHLDQSIQVINDFFYAEKVVEAMDGNRCKLLTSIAMLYSVEELNTFVAQAKQILADDGVWCIQISYLPETIRTLSFYDVCHEHLFYFSLQTISDLMQRHGLAVFDASTNSVNGGSVRLFVTHEENRLEPTDRLRQIAETEQKFRLTDGETYRSFSRQVDQLKGKVTGYLQRERDRGNLVIGLAASTKGNVLLQLFDIGKDLLPYISERSPEKVSLRTLGTDIELVSEQDARDLNPSCMLVLVWFFKDEIIKREREYLENGGTLLFPMPYCHLVTKDGETRL